MAAVASVQKSVGQIAVRPLSAEDVETAIDADSLRNPSPVVLQPVQGLPDPNSSASTATSDDSMTPSTRTTGAKDNDRDPAGSAAPATDHSSAGDTNSHGNTDQRGPQTTPSKATPTRSPDDPVPSTSSSAPAEPSDDTSTSESSRRTHSPSASPTDRTDRGHSPKPTITSTSNPSSTHTPRPDHTRGHEAAPTPSVVPTPAPPRHDD